MTIARIVVERIIQRLLKGEDYRVEIVNLINSMFLQNTLEFFRKVIDAKLKARTITSDWYRDELLGRHVARDELILNAGLNDKTIKNMHNSAKREVVLTAVNENYDKLLAIIEELVEDYNEMEIKLTLKFRDVSVELNISESLIVINSLAVMRAALRGGAWSSAGKQVEKPLLLTLCSLYAVHKDYYELTGLSEEGREVDFFLFDRSGRKYRCEVKLMGQGNPESADAFIARDSQIFVADKLSDLNKSQLDTRGVAWVELRGAVGIAKFGEILSSLQIPHSATPMNDPGAIDNVLASVLDNFGS